MPITAEKILSFLRTEASQAAMIKDADLPRVIEDAKQALDPSNPRTVYWLAVLLARPEAARLNNELDKLLSTLSKD